MRPLTFLPVVVLSLVLLSPVRSLSQCLLSGDYVSTPSPAYSCTFGLVEFDVDQWNVTVSGNAIYVIGLFTASGFGNIATRLVGTIDCQAGTFTATRVIPGSCTETYTLTGQIQSLGSWTGTFTASFAGSCSGCVNQTYQVSGALPPTGVQADGAPPSLAWMEAGPNPFDSFTTLRVHLDSRQYARLVIHDVAGRRVATLVAGAWLEAGDHSYAWDRRTTDGRKAPSGIYFVQLRTDAAERVAKLVVLD